MELIQDSPTIINCEGKILLYSIEDFHKKIVLEGCCFICGAERGTKKFNDEHVLPKWLLKKYNLFNRRILLPNSNGFKYSEYVISCCEECNSELGRLVEIPVSKLLNLSHKEFSNQLARDKNNVQLLFQWLLLIFFKTHIRDTGFNWFLDKREGNAKIGDLYDWEGMHHIHCMIRQHYTNAKVDFKTTGSILIVPVIQHSSIDPFDFMDNKVGSTIMIKLDDFCIISVLNDSCAALNMLSKFIEKIKGSLSPFQLKDLFSHFLYVNLHLKESPTYYSSFNTNGDYQIIAKLPKKIQLIEEKDREITHGYLLYNFCKDMISDEIENKELILKEIKDGKRQYLFDEKGEFIDWKKDFKLL